MSNLAIKTREWCYRWQHVLACIQPAIFAMSDGRGQFELVRATGTRVCSVVSVMAGRCSLRDTGREAPHLVAYSFVWSTLTTLKQISVQMGEQQQPQAQSTTHRSALQT